MKYIVKNSLIMNKYREGSSLPGTTIEELEEDLGSLFAEGIAVREPRFKVVEGLAVERSLEDIKSSESYKNKIRALREDNYKKRTDSLALEISYMEISGKSKEDIDAKKAKYIEEVEAIKASLPLE